MKHVVHIYANNSYVPYMNWFAERKNKYPDIKFSVIALYHERPKMIEDMKERGCDVYWVKYDCSKRKRGMISVFFKLLFLLKKLNPDVVNTHMFDDSLPGLWAARILKIKNRIIYKQETGFHWVYTPQWVGFDKFNNANATWVVAPSEESRMFIINNEKADRRKTVTIHSGIDFESLTAQKKNDKDFFIEKYDLKDKIVIGTIARFIDWKGYKYIVQAAPELKKRYPEIRFLFIGEGLQMEEIKQMAKDRNVDDVICFLGWIDEEQIPSLFGVMTIYLHAASLEPFGFVLSEAMVNKVPIVFNKTGGAGDVLTHKLNCYFTEPKQPASIVDGVCWTIENIESLKKEMESVKQIAGENFNIDHMLDRFVELYRK